MKKIRKRRHSVNIQRPTAPPPALPTYEWVDGEGFHFLAPGQAPTLEQLEEMTRVYQKIRSDPRWAEIVRQVGLEKADELLQQCRVEVRPVRATA